MFKENKRSFRRLLSIMNIHKSCGNNHSANTCLMKEKGDVKMKQTIPMLVLMILWTVVGATAQPQHGGERPRPWHDGGHGPGGPGGPAPFGPGGHAPGGPGGPGGARQQVTGSAVEVFSGTKGSCALPSQRSRMCLWSWPKLPR